MLRVNSLLFYTDSIPCAHKEREVSYLVNIQQAKVISGEWNREEKENDPLYCVILSLCMEWATGMGKEWGTFNTSWQCYCNEGVATLAQVNICYKSHVVRTRSSASFKRKEKYKWSIRIKLFSGCNSRTSTVQTSVQILCALSSL